MKKALLILFILSIALPLFSVAPTTRDGEVIVISYDDESHYGLLSRALREEVSPEWYEKYTSRDSLLIMQSINPLSSLLPLSNFVMTREENNAINVISLVDGTRISFTFSDDLIHAISF